MNTASFAKGAQKASSSLSSIANSSAITAMSTGFLAVGHAVGTVIDKVTAAGRAIASMVSHSLDMIDQMKDSAQQAGVTTEALGKLQFAAKQNGSSAEAVTNAVSIMNARLGKAAAEGGPVADALERIGLNAQQLVAMSPDQAFTEIAEGFSRVNNTAERAHVAQQIFGKGGRELINILSLGRAGLEEMSAQAERFGIVLNQVDANKVGAAKDALDLAGDAVQALKNKLAVELAPFIEAAARALAEMAGIASAAFANDIFPAIRMVAVGIARMTEVTKGAEIGWHALKAIVLGAVAAAITAFDELGKATVKLFNLLGGDFKWDDNISAMAQSFRDDTIAAVEDINNTITRDRGKAVGEWFDEVRKRANEAAEMQRQTQANQQQASRTAATDTAAAVVEASSTMNKDLALASSRALADVVSKFSGGDGKTAAFEKRFTTGFRGDNMRGDPSARLLKEVARQTKVLEKSLRATERIAAQEPIEVADI